MFVVVFVVCNLVTGQCLPLTPEIISPSERACHLAAEYAQEQAKEALPSYAAIEYQCVEFSEPT